MSIAFVCGVGVAVYAFCIYWIGYGDGKYAEMHRKSMRGIDRNFRRLLQLERKEALRRTKESR